MFSWPPRLVGSEVAEPVRGAANRVALETTGVAVRVVGDLDRDLRRDARLHDDGRIPSIPDLERRTLEHAEREVQRLGDPDVIGALDDELVPA